MLSIRISFLKNKLIFTPLIIIVLELFIRIIIGIGDPILYKEHPTIEYEQLPNQKVRVFNNQIFINSLGMKSDPLLIQKNKNQKRILVYGDSVIFGGNLISNKNLATNILQNKLNIHGNKFEVGNISSGSWGPGNWLAHMKEKGIYNADHVLIVINSNDFFDIPQYEPLNKNILLPTKKPFSAIIYSLDRYLIPNIKYLNKKLLRYFFNNNNENIYNKNNSKNYLKENATNDLIEIIKFLEKQNVGISVVQFWDKSEYINEKPRKSNIDMRRLFQKRKINIMQSINDFKECSLNPNDLYVDNIHPYKKKGQICLAKIMMKSLESNQNL